MQPLWDDADPKIIREIGHYVYGGKETPVRLEVYNFNSVPVKGTIEVICDDTLTFNKKTIEQFNTDVRKKRQENN